MRLRGLLDITVARRIERRLEGLSGVVRARVSDDFSALEVSSVGQVRPAEFLASLLEDYGVMAWIEPSASPRGSRARGPELAGRVLRRAWMLAGLGAVATFVARFAAFNEQVRAAGVNAQAIVSGVFLAWAMGPLLRDGFRRLFAGHAAPEILPLAAGAVTFSASLAAFVAGDDPAFEAAMVTWFATALLHWQGHVRLRRAGARLSELDEVRGASVAIRTHEGEFTVPAEAAAIGDSLLVGPGRLIVADGVVSEGSGVVDGGPLSSAGVRRLVEPGAQVWAGQRVLEGGIVARVVRNATQSSAIRLGRQQAGLPEESAWLDRAAVYWLLAWTSVNLAALAAAGVWYVAATDELGSLEQGAIHAGLAVLLAGAPLALALSLRRILLRAAAESTRIGVAFRSLESVWRLGGAREVVFDRTGTLTCGKPELYGWVVRPETDPSEVWSMVLALESDETHPVARARRGRTR